MDSYDGVCDLLRDDLRLRPDDFANMSVNRTRYGNRPRPRCAHPSSTLFACQMHKWGCGYNKNNGLAGSEKFLVVTRLA